MMFIIRTSGERPHEHGFAIRMERRAPQAAPGGTRDYFCDGDPDAAKQKQLTVVTVHDGWYADDTGGGAAIWGQGIYWEIRDTPFTIKQSSADAAPLSAGTAAETEIVDVRKAIFGV